MDLAELKSRYAAATPGEWSAFIRTRVVEIQFDGKPPIVSWPGFDDSLRPWGAHAANAEFIAAIHNAFPELVKEIERLERERDEALEEVKRLEALINDYTDTE